MHKRQRDGQCIDGVIGEVLRQRVEDRRRNKYRAGQDSRGKRDALEGTETQRCPALRQDGDNDSEQEDQHLQHHHLGQADAPRLAARVHEAEDDRDGDLLHNHQRVADHVADLELAELGVHVELLHEGRVDVVVLVALLAIVQDFPPWADRICGCCCCCCCLDSSSSRGSGQRL